MAISCWIEGMEIIDKDRVCIYVCIDFACVCDSVSLMMCACG